MMLNNPNYFGGVVKIFQDQPKTIRGVEQAPVVSTLAPGNNFSDNFRGLGVAEMADAISNGRKNRASKELALHVLDVLESIEKSGRSGKFINVKSTCEKPVPFLGIRF